MLDEKALRRADFRGGVAVVLADGQAWTLPRPEYLWAFDDSEAGASLGFDLGPEYDALARAIESAATVGDVARSVLKAAAFLLRLNYDLDGPALATLLRAHFSEPAEGAGEADPQRIGRELAEVATGNVPAPKASPVGDASA